MLMQLLPSIPATVKKGEGDATVLHLDMLFLGGNQPAVKCVIQDHFFVVIIINK